ncbi:MAG TPA: sugar ABC transporter ATP-binding protein, partial [Clostridiaceae bacterium]|nr:sugar ABC transporter ATP-binding protein [Clostridiaceae bacterium]
KRFMEQETLKALEKFNLKLDPRQEVSTLTIAEQSLVQIVKALYFKPKILILDEPTSALSIDQKDNIFRIIRELCQQNKTTILYVSHRLEEVMEIGDRVTVLRDGKYIDTKDIKDISVNDIVSMMVGRQITKINVEKDRKKGKQLLKVENLNRKNMLHNINFELAEGEILGFAGFVGSRRTELMRAIFGLDKINSGNIYIEGKKVKISSPKVAIRNGIGFIPENRKDDALIPLMSIAQNMIVLILKELSKFLFINKRKEKNAVSELIKKLAIKVSDSSNLITSLSGGNQQKVIIARWLSRKPKILICDEPTRGIDVGAKKEVHSILLELAKQGMGVIVVSSELPEVLSISDRIIVMHEGKITGEFSNEEATEEKVMMKAAALEE